MAPLEPNPPKVDTSVIEIAWEEYITSQPLAEILKLLKEGSDSGRPQFVRYRELEDMLNDAFMKGVCSGSKIATAEFKSIIKAFGPK